MNYIDTIKQRRSIYHISNKVALSDSDLIKLIQDAVKESPSAFNSQSSRAVILLDQAHLRFWKIVEDTLRKQVPADQFDSTEKKLAGFAAGKGTVLFYEDQNVVRDLQAQYATYADNFPVWSEHASAIAQFNVWTALATQNIGASLQHYNPIVDEQTASTFNIPADWTLRAQLVFGVIESPAGEKSYIPDEQRFRVFQD